MMRLDRFLTLHVFRYLAAVLPQPKGIRIPILMYHSISDEPENGIHPYYRINTSPKRFAEHMQFLHDNYYKVIDLSEAVRLISAESSGSPNPPTFHPSNIPQKKVVLTFDDGYKDFYTQAFPVLYQYNFTSTVFLPTAFIGGRKPGLREKLHLSWSEIKELQQKGIVFGSHTVTHRQLQDLDKKEVVLEIKNSKEVIEERIGNEVRSFSYPYRFPSQENGFIQILRSILSEVDYQNGVNTEVGVNGKGEDRFFLKRLPVNSSDDIRFFQSKLEGGYNWIRSFQRFYKNIVGSSRCYV